MNNECLLCDGACAGAELQPLLDRQLRWLWEQIGRAADRRGDAALIEGSLSVRAPDAPNERAAAAGLLGARVLRQGQARRIDLTQLTRKLRVRGAQLTPGAVAAHALGRRLAARAAAHVQRREQEGELLRVFVGAASSVADAAFCERNRIWVALRRSGWIARLLVSDEPERLLRSRWTSSPGCRLRTPGSTAVALQPMRPETPMLSITGRHSPGWSSPYSSAPADSSPGEGRAPLGRRSASTATMSLADSSRLACFPSAGACLREPS